MTEGAAEAELAALGERIDHVLRGPDAIESQLLFRVARPIFAIGRWRASLQTKSLTALVAELGGGGSRSAEALAKTALGPAIAELEANVVAIERVAIVRRRAPTAHAVWLRRVHSVLTLADRAIRATIDGAPDATFARAASRADASALFAPLVSLEPAGKSRRPSDDTIEPSPVLVDLELATIDHLFAAARTESLVLGRKRRLLIAARQRLLEASAALSLERDGVRDRMRYAAREITRIDRLEATGLAADVSLVHQARQALVRRDPTRLFACLSAIDHNALSAMDGDVSTRTSRALARIRGGEDDDGASTASFQRSAAELLGVVAADVDAAVQESREKAQAGLALGGLPNDRVAAKSLLAYLPEDGAAEILRAAVTADGFFEVGGALSAVRVDEEARVLRVVRHPTQALVLMPAEDVDDLRDAVIGDPRSILFDLATGRLFARRFVREELHHRPRVVRRAEVRVYVLDGSGSMRGPRARVRDAILVAELSTLIRRLEEPGDTRCTLLYRYFDEELGVSKRIDTVRGARDAIRDIVATERVGGTNIQKALVASLEQIAEARTNDPELARAQIVLVTDGEAPVDEDAIAAARQATLGLPIGISVIALGDENPALRGIVARQRAKGEAAFYHFIDDVELASITNGTLTVGAIHPPSRWDRASGEHARTPDELARALDDEVGGLLDELEGIDRERDVAALERLEDEAQARRDVGLVSAADDGVGAAEVDGELARIEALRKDRIALAARYARWFPEPPDRAVRTAPLSPRMPARGTPERDDVDATCCALASIAEVVALLGGTELARQADAIDLIERLLPDARLSPARYRAILREFPDAIEASLRSVRDAVTGRP